MMLLLITHWGGGLTTRGGADALAQVEISGLPYPPALEDVTGRFVSMHVTPGYLSRYAYQLAFAWLYMTGSHGCRCAGDVGDW